MVIANHVLHPRALELLLQVTAQLLAIVSTAAINDARFILVLVVDDVYNLADCLVVLLLLDDCVFDFWSIEALLDNKNVFWREW